MFCENCGKQNPDGARFCEACGSAMAAEAPAAAPEVPVEPTATETPAAFEAPAAPETPAAPAFPGANIVNGLKKEHKLAILGVAGVVVVVILLAIFGVFKSGPVKVVEKYLNGMTKYNAKKVYDTTQACPYISGDMDKDEIKEEIEDAQDEADDEKQNNKDNDYKVTFKKVKKAETYKKSEVKEIEEYLEDTKDYDVDEYPLQGVARVKATVTVNDDGDKDTETVDIITVKVKGKWYVATWLSEYLIEDVILD